MMGGAESVTLLFAVAAVLVDANHRTKRERRSLFRQRPDMTIDDIDRSFYADSTVSLESLEHGLEGVLFRMSYLYVEGVISAEELSILNEAHDRLKALESRPIPLPEGDGTGFKLDVQDELAPRKDMRGR
jgi:hypothetical protein